MWLESSEAGQMAQWLRGLAALAEDPGSVPNTHIAPEQPIAPRDPKPLSKDSRYMVHKQTFRQKK